MYILRCVRENETKMFFCNICYKTLAILVKFAANFFRQFTLHLNNVSTLPCTRCSAIAFAERPCCRMRYSFRQK